MDPGGDGGLDLCVCGAWRDVREIQNNNYQQYDDVKNTTVTLPRFVDDE